MSLVESARLFATKAHCFQTRKFSGEPYIVHPQKVAEIVADSGGTDEMIAAAWLHDTLEDTSVTYEEILREFGQSVADMVEELTDKFTDKSIDRTIRKSLERDRIQLISRESQTIKIADTIANLEDIYIVDKEFAIRYLEEKRAIYHVLDRGDKYLRSKLDKILSSIKII